MSHTATDKYYVPHTAPWPIVGSIGLFTAVFGGALWLNEFWMGKIVLAAGFAAVLVMMFGWFGSVIRESEGGYYNAQVDRSYRWGMSWFIFSEVMFFGGFFGALFYAHMYAVPWLSGGASHGFFTNALLWSGYQGGWPTNGPAQLGGEFETMPAVGIAAINTVILLTSSVTVTIAHWGLKQDNRKQVILGLLATVILGFAFVALQAHEYIDAYVNMNLTLHTGIYGTTFFMLTGFHGLHVTIGAIMLTVILIRVIKGHFSSHHHFGFEAVSWYWHFVDVVWLCLYLFVYWL
ncbi:MAG TPA: cytochrome c oxidase subunit 3 [Gammaproteobacteria bacterium]|jgi:cytochrome c oxidase subunit 3|nr:cytochrome c oxidase subunit 3 [Gammaproteobacteria bacterium]